MNNRQPTLLVLAAGMGNRYGGLKQIDSFGPSGETIIDYLVYDAVRAGFGKIVFVIRRCIESAFREKFGRRYENRIRVEYAFQELDALPEGFAPPVGRERPWGTGHAVLMASEVIHEPFAVVNADDFYGAHSFRVLCERLQSLGIDDEAQTASRDASGRERYVMVGFILRNTLSDYGTVARGVCHINEHNHVLDIRETVGIARNGHGAVYPDKNGALQRLTGDETVSMNMWGFTPSFFEHLRDQFVEFMHRHGQEERTEFYLPSVVNRLIASNEADVEVLTSPDAWFGVTYREDKPIVEKSIQELIAEGVYSADIWGD